MDSLSLPPTSHGLSDKVLRLPGLGTSGTAYFIASLSECLAPQEEARPVLVIAPSAQLAEALLADLRFFVPSESVQINDGHTEFHSRVLSFFGWEVLPFDLLSPTVPVSAARLYTLAQLAAGRPCIVVATIDALQQKLPPPEAIVRSLFTIRAGAPLERDELIGVLDRGGYTRTSLVEEPGQAAVRGLVVDFFPPGSLHPVRVELFADKVESLRLFDASTQRTRASLSSFRILPVRELFVGAGEKAIDEAVARLRQRASELSLPQKRVKPLEEALETGAPWPGIEHLQPLLTPDTRTLWDYLSPDTAVVVCEERKSLQVAEDFDALLEEREARAQQEARLYPEPHRAYISSAELTQTIRRRACCYCNELELTHTSEDAAEDAGREPPVEIQRIDALRAALQGARQQERPFQPLAEEIKLRRRQGMDVLLTASSSARAERLSELLDSYGVSAGLFEGSYADWSSAKAADEPRGEVVILEGLLSGGLRLPGERRVLVSDLDLFPDTRPRRKSASAQTMRRMLGAVSQLKEDDYIVHVDYGIGIYRGLRQLSVEGQITDFLQLEYAEGAKLFVPVEQIGKVQKYSGAEGKRPALTKLGGKSWEKAKSKVKENVAALAGQLLKVMAERELVQGFSFGPPDVDDARFADSFPYEETADQHAAIEAVLADMAREQPMDRLVCGDVGYGKTEVALRAAFKAANAGKQTAVLVPTTILADQHFENFKNRFADTAVKIGCVSRFFPSAQNKETLAALARGEVDIIIGTHRLLQKDVHFKDLGLIIIDEEHRFGVAHKERLKRIRTEVDVLTLTATPIPRTLHMSLVGIRDLSLIETPPVNRQVTRTYIAPYEDSVVREAVLRELNRSGQIFYIHNRVQTIFALAAELQALVPEARIGVAHGQMKEQELETVMHRFINHEIDLLLSTTIVESGLDIPNANTIIIRHADKFGLAELYQLRGRVGRSDRRAYAYLLISDPKTLGEEARKRLQVLQSLDDLGVGFRLALQDMEIRGAGNLLGKDQSGQINLVGYELYSRILKDAVQELRRQRRKEAGAEVETVLVDDPELHLGFPAHIPTFYIPDVAERLLLYQRLIELRGLEDAEEIAEEIEDRFGTLPDEVQILLDLMAFRGLLRRAGIVSATFKNRQLSVKFHQDVSLEPRRLLDLVQASAGTVKLSPSNVVSLLLPEVEVDRPLVLYRQLERFLGRLGASVP